MSNHADVIAELQRTQKQQELVITEMLAWIGEYYPALGYTPELREKEYEQLIDNIRRVSRGEEPVRRPIEEMTAEEDDD